MKYKLNKHYLVIKGNEKESIHVGDSIYIRYLKNKYYSKLGEYLIELTSKDSLKKYSNIFYHKSELVNLLETIELEYNIQLILKEAITKQLEIFQILKDYGISKIKFLFNYLKLLYVRKK